MSLSKFEVSVVVPKEATNLVTNPSFEVGVTGYTVYGGSGSRSTLQSRRGIASFEITPSAGGVSWVYCSVALTSGIQYSFSVDILDIPGQIFQVYATNSGGAVKSVILLWTGTGHWRRKYVTFTADANDTFSFYIIKQASAATTPYYTDGWQLEVGAVSTYLDGSLTGFVNGQTDYRWNGTPNASTSWRSGQTRSGGTYVKISTYAKILDIIGLGAADVNNISIPSTTGGSYYQDTVVEDRAFSVVCNVRGGGDYAVIEKARAALINAVKPDATNKKQPLLLQIDQLNSSNIEIAETLLIKCFYSGGLGGGGGNAYNEKIAIDFRSYSPLLFQDGDHATALGYQTAIASAAFVLWRNMNGLWAVMGTGATGFPPFVMVDGLDGAIYAGGAFTAMGGVANTARIAKWDGTTWAALATGANSAVNALIVAANGYIYAGGLFTNLGSAAGDYVAYWNGSAWNAVGTGTGGEVLALAIVQDALYAGGKFVNLTDANGDYISKWTGAAWESLGTGMNGDVNALFAAADGTIYAGGAFTVAGGVTGTAYIAKWNGTAWLPLTTGTNGIVYAICGGPDGAIYVAGAFTAAGGVANTSHIAKWNGSSWESLGTGAPLAVSINSLVFNNGSLYAGGMFASIGGVATADSVAQWNGSSWMPLDVVLPTGITKVVYSIVPSRNGDLYLSFYSSGTAYSATVTAANVGSATAYPRIVLTGPGTCSQLKNYTTGKSIFFNLTLLAGETAILDLDPEHTSFTSTFRGNILNTILPGSDLTWQLMPGANNVSAFMSGSTTAATALSMIWQDQYWSLDGAVR
jgi:hypothetical protein